MPRSIIDSVQGTLDFLILKTLPRGEMHGYAIARWILDASGDELQIEEGTLYPALHRLEDRGWIEAEWGLSENNRRAKNYALTAAGRAELAEWTLGWTRFTRAAERVLGATTGGAWERTMRETPMWAPVPAAAGRGAGGGRGGRDRLPPGRAGGGPGARRPG